MVITQRGCLMGARGPQAPAESPFRSVWATPKGHPAAQTERKKLFFGGAGYPLGAPPNRPLSNYEIIRYFCIQLYSSSTRFKKWKQGGVILPAESRAYT